MVVKSAHDTHSTGTGKGTLFLWPDHWQVLGQLMPNRAHRHISASLLVGLDQPFRLQVDGQWRRTRAAVVAPDVPQALDPGSAAMWIAQLDPDSLLWRALAPLVADDRSADIALSKEMQLPAGEAGCAEMRGYLSGLVKRVGHPPVALDDRVARVCESLRRDLPDKLDVSALAVGVGLSSSRLSHLFRQQTGVPLRRFLLHLKMNRALTFWEPGKPVSHVAAEAGFYDQPHLVRTAREMFDALPSEIIAKGWLRVCRCPSA